MKRKEKLLHFWFNTFFVSEGFPDDEVLNGNDEVATAAADRSQRARSYDATGCALNLSEPIPHRPTRSNSLTTVQCSRPYVLRLSKTQIDKAHKDKQDKIFPPDFEVNERDFILLVCRDALYTCLVYLGNPVLASLPTRSIGCSPVTGSLSSSRFP